MGILTYVYTKYIKREAVSAVIGTVKPAVCSLVFAAFCTVFLPVCFGVKSVTMLGGAEINVVTLLIFVCAFVLCRTRKVSPILIIFACGAVGAVLL